MGRRRGEKNYSQYLMIKKEYVHLRTSLVETRSGVGSDARRKGGEEGEATSERGWRALVGVSKFQGIQSITTSSALVMCRR